MRKSTPERTRRRTPRTPHAHRSPRPLRQASDGEPEVRPLVVHRGAVLPFAIAHERVHNRSAVGCNRLIAGLCVCSGSCQRPSHIPPNRVGHRACGGDDRRKSRMRTERLQETTVHLDERRRTEALVHRRLQRVECSLRLTDAVEGILLYNFGRLDEAIRSPDKAIRPLDAPSDVQWWLAAAASRLGYLTFAGRFADSEASIDHVYRFAQTFGISGGILYCDWARAFPAHLRRGDLPALESWAEGLLTTHAATGQAPYLLQYLRAVSLAERGEPQAALAVAMRSRSASISASFSGGVEGCELWCIALLHNGDWSARYTEHQHLLPRADAPRYMGQTLFALFLAIAHVTRGDLEATAALYPVLRQILEDGLRIGPLQPVEGLVGLAAAAGGNWDVAEGHFLAALAFVDEIGDRLGKPSVQKWYAWMLLRRAAPGDRDQARALLDEAVPAFRAMGMTLSLGEAEAMRRSLDG